KRDLQRRSAVNAGRLDELVGHAFQRGEVNQNVEARVLPQNRNENRVQDQVRIRQPQRGPVHQAQRRQQAVENAQARVIHPGPQLGDGHRRQQQRQHVHFAEKVGTLDFLRQNQGRQQVPSQSQRGEDGQQRRVFGAVPEDAVLQQVLVVFQADEGHLPDAVPLGQAVPA